MARLLVAIDVADDDLARGWNGDTAELWLSVKARMDEVYGDDGGAYQPHLVLANGSLYDAAQRLGHLDGHLWTDLAPTLSCTEAEAFAALITAAHGADEAADFLAAHARSDERGDQHYTPGQGG